MHNKSGGHYTCYTDSVYINVTAVYLDGAILPINMEIKTITQGDFRDYGTR